MRRLIPLLLALAVTFLPAVSASADGEGWGVGGDVTTPGNSGSAPGRGGPGPRGYAHVYTRWSTDCTPTGGWYLEVTYRPTPQDPAVAAQQREYFATWPTNDHSGEGVCPGGGIDIVATARSFWLTVVPGGATPTIDPGELVTGLPAYLVLEGEQTISRTTTPHPSVTLSISGEATYVIDWGDGTAPTSTSSQGVAYPGGPGEITHTYTSVPPGGVVTITVTTIWTGTSTAGPLPTIERTETITLPVQQVQAVRER